jgi:predicted HNH restriction endonuclease
MTPEENKRELSVHHIIPFRVFGKNQAHIANDLENLMAVCVKCHHIAEAYSRELYPLW